MKRQIYKRMLAVLLGVSMVLPGMPSVGTQAAQLQAEEPQKIVFEKVSAMAANGHEADLIKDGDKNTYWQSIPSNGDNVAYKKNYAHNRYIDITLDGMYDLSQVKIFNNVDNEGTYNNYYIYASTDGVNYDKIISKTSNDVATTEGDSYDVDVTASHIRLNMAYNSDTYVTNLAEIEVYGVRVGERQDDTTGIQVSDWKGSEWQKEWDKFEKDKVYAEAKVLAEMKNLVGRVIGEEWQDDFQFELRNSFQDGKDIFEVTDGEDGTILIRGNNGIALASGFNYYLKNYVNVDFNPLFGSNTTMPEKIVPVGETVIKEAQYNLRYALNFCTYSYTMAFWNWDEYEEFLDWAAMNGLNLILDIVGQEEVLRQTFLEYGFTNEEIKDYICGPAYFAWFYMQNLYTVGGPLPDAWFEQRTELGRKIHDRMQTYGITPVLQGFSGQVPETFAQKNEGAQMAPQDTWPGHDRPSLLMTYVSEGQTDYFKQVAETFYDKQKNVFGDISDYYATDPFHEGGRTGSLDVATIYETVQNGMIESNPEAVWILQQWQDGLSDGVKISRLDTSHVLVLDLQSDMRQQNWPFEQRSIPWLYCMLHNFGGRMGLDGEVPVVATDPMETYNNKNYMVGIGITPEALENSPVAYELFLEVLWTKDPIDYHEWIDGYAKRRAGGESESLQEAWDILVETAYADKGVYYQGAAETVMNARPGDNFKSASTWGHSGIYYDKEKLDEALRLLAENYTAFSNSDAFKYDLADVAEQVICNVAVEYHSRMVAAKNAKNVEEFTKYSKKFLALFDLSDQILSTTDEFMLGTWIAASRKMITDADDWTKDLFEFNARSLVTTWGGESPAGNGGLKDYSNRKWAGLTSSFYKERWGIWVRNRLAELKGTAKDSADEKAENNWFMWEYQWTNRKSDDENGKYAFATTPDLDVDLGTLAKEVYDNYSYTALLREDGVGEEVVNALKGKTPVLTGNTSEGSLENIVDGDTGNNWIGTGTGDHILEFDLKGTFQLREFQISIPQLAKNFPYYYKIETWNSDSGEWELVAEYSERQLGSNTVVAPKESMVATKIRLTMNTSDAVDSALTITDFAAYGISLEQEVPDDPNTPVYINWALPETATIELDSNTQSHTDKKYLNDGKNEGNSNELWIAKGDSNTTTPAVFTMTFNEQGSVLANHIDLYFEKKNPQEIELRFQVMVTDEMGIETEITNTTHTSPENGKLTERVYSLPVNKKIQKVEVSIWENNPNGAWPALSEIEVIQDTRNESIASKSKVSLSEGDVSQSGKSLDALIDGNTSNIWVADGNVSSYPVTLTLDFSKIVHANYMEVYFEKDKIGLPFEFEVQAIDKNGDEIIVSNEYADHNDTLKSDRYQFAIGQDVQKVMVTLLGKTGVGSLTGVWPALAEIGVYGVIYNENIVKDRIDGIRVTLDSLNYDGYTGSYNIQEKAELEEILTQVEETLKDNPDAQTQENLLKQINTAFDKFYKEGKVYIDRGNLLAALSKAGQMLEGLKDGDLQEEKAVLEPAYQSAKQVYDTYRVTQSQVDDAAQALETVVNTYYETFLNYKFANKLAEAKELLKKVLVYTAESLEDLESVIAETETVEGAEAKETAYRRLENAIKSLEKILCVEITWKSNLSSEGVDAGNGKYAVEDKVTLSAEDVEGYKFAGWYIGKQQVSQESTYEYVVKETDIDTKINFVAKYEVLVEVSWKSEPIPGGVTVGSGYYAAGEQVELSANEMEGVKFIGWYLGEDEISKELSCEYTVKETDRKVELVAKYESLTLVDVSDTELYVGETAMLIAPTDVTIEVSEEGIVEIDRDTMTVAAIGAGEVELIFNKDGEVIGTEIIVVLDGDIIQKRREDMKQLSLSITSNTEEANGESGGNGVDDAIIDGNSDTFWHSQWQGNKFVVSESNPAWVEVDLGEELEIPGFVFQQRNNPNGLIQKYSYEARDAAGQVVASKAGIIPSDQEQAQGAEVLVKFAKNLKVKTVKILVLKGSGEFACMSEFYLPMKKKVAVNGQVTLEDVKLALGKKITLEPVCVDNTFVKGLVWSSSNEEIATVNTNGVVTGLNVGIATITAKNAAGVEASCEIEVGNDISEYTIILSETEYTYDGTVKKPTVSVVDSYGEILEAANYIVTYEDAASVNAGTYNVTVTLKGENLMGETVRTYKINKSSVPVNATIELSEDSFVYNGSIQKPKVTVKDADNQLISDTEYIVVYSNNYSKKVGTYRVTVDFKNYKEVLTASYVIMEESEEPVEPEKHQVYAVTNLTETLRNIALPEGWKWEDETIVLKTFAGHNEKLFTAKDADGNLREVIVKLSTIQNLSVTSEAGTNKALKVATGAENATLTLDYDVLGCELSKEVEEKLLWKVASDKETIAKAGLVVEEETKVSIEAVSKGTANLTITLAYKDGENEEELLNYKQKVTVVDSSNKGIAEVVVGLGANETALTPGEDGVYVVAIGKTPGDNVLELTDKTREYGKAEEDTHKTFKVSYKSSDSSVAKVGKTSGKVTKLEVKKAGYAVITATAKDTTGSTYRIPVRVVDYSDASIVLSQTSVTVNKALREAKAELKVYNGFGGKLTAVTFNGNPLVKDTDFTEEGSIYFSAEGKGTLKVTVSDGEYEVSKEFKKVTVKETDQAPKVTIKQIRNLNAQYKEGSAQFMIGADGAEVEAVTVDGCTGEYNKESKILTLDNVTGAKKECFKVTIPGYSTIEKNVSVKQDKESFKLSATSGILYQEAVGETTVYKGRMEVQLLNKKTGVAESGFEVSCENTNYEVNPENGKVVITAKETGTVKNNDKLTLKFTSEKWRNPEGISQSFKVKVVKMEKAALQLGSKSVTLYNYKGYEGVTSQVSTSLSLKGGSKLVGATSEDVTISGGNENLSAEYNEATGNVVVRADENLKKGTYKLTIQMEGMKEVTLKVKAVDVVKTEKKTQATATVKKSGSIDVLNRNGSQMVLKGSFKNVAKDAVIKDIKLSGRDAYLFEIVNESGKNVTIQLKDDVAVLTKYAYKVGVEYTIDNGGEKDLALTGNTLDIKLSQKKPKVKVEGDNVYSNAKNETAALNVALYNSTGVKIDAKNVRLLNFTKDFAYDFETGTLTHKASGETAIGKTYSLKFEVVAKDAAENEKPVTVVYKVKVVK